MWVGCPTTDESCSGLSQRQAHCHYQCKAAHLCKESSHPANTIYTYVYSFSQTHMHTQPQIKTPIDCHCESVLFLAIHSFPPKVFLSFTCLCLSHLCVCVMSASRVYLSLSRVCTYICLTNVSVSTSCPCVGLICLCVSVFLCTVSVSCVYVCLYRACKCRVSRDPCACF